MNFRYKLKRFFRNIALENLMTYVAASMAIIFMGDLLTENMITPLLIFNREAILAGQVWRIITFLLVPQTHSVLWIAVSVYFYWFLGRDIEDSWGSHNLTLYVLLGAAMLIGVGFLTGFASSHYLYFSLFLVYAYLNPNREIRLFALIPLAAKWIALIDIVFMLYGFAQAFAYYTVGAGGTAAGIQLSILASFVCFAVFFGRTYIERFRSRIRHKDFISEMRRKKIRAAKRKEDDDDE